MSGVCPNCGWDLELDQPLVSGGFVSIPRMGVATFKGKRLNLSPQMLTTLHTLMKAKGTPVHRAAIAERLGYEGDANIPDVMLSKLRRVIRECGAGAPIGNVWGKGPYWSLPVHEVPAS